MTAAVPDSRFRDQLAEDLATWLRARYPVTPAEARAEAHDLITEVIHPAANQLAAKMLREAADWIWDEAPALASASAELHARADHLASPAPAPRPEEGQR